MIHRATLEQSQLIDDVCDFCNEQIGTVTNNDGNTIIKYIPYWVTEYGCVCNECCTTLPIAVVCQECGSSDTYKSGHSPMCVELQYRCRECGQDTWQ